MLADGPPDVTGAWFAAVPERVHEASGQEGLRLGYPEGGRLGDGALGAMAKIESEETYIRRARSARVRMQLADEGSAEWIEAKEEERRSLEGLRRAFGVVDQATIDWLVDRKVTTGSR